MFKRIVALLVTALLALTAAACADTYTDRDRDLTFEYDAAAFEVTSDEADDVLVVTLTGSRTEWGAYGIAFDLRDLDDGDPVPKLSDYTDNLEEGAQAPESELSFAPNVRGLWQADTGSGVWTVTYRLND